MSTFNLIILNEFIRTRFVTAAVTYNNFIWNDIWKRTNTQYPFSQPIPNTPHTKIQVYIKYLLCIFIFVAYRNSYTKNTNQFNTGCSEVLSSRYTQFDSLVFFFCSHWNGATTKKAPITAYRRIFYSLSKAEHTLHNNSKTEFCSKSIMETVTLATPINLAFKSDKWVEIICDNCEFFSVFIYISARACVLSMQLNVIHPQPFFALDLNLNGQKIINTIKMRDCPKRLVWNQIG